MRKNVFVIILVLLSCIYASNTFSQVAANTATFPRHITTDQQTIGVFFPFLLGGSTNTGHWTVQIDPDGAGALPPVTVPVISVSISETGIFGAVATLPGTGNVVAVRFNASTVSIGHPAYLLPRETITISFVNGGGNTLTRFSDSAPVLSFGPFASKNTYVPLATGAGDISFSGENIAGVDGGVLDQCAPVNTSYLAFTYVYSLRFRNSSAWVTTNNRLRVNWGNGADQSDLQGYLSNGAGDNSPNQAPIAAGPGGGPGVFVSFRSGLNPALAAAGNPFTLFMDGTNQYIYPRNTGVCNFRTTQYPIGVGTAVYDAVGSATLQRNSQFNSYDFDNTNTGTLAMTPTVPPALGTTTTEQVCIGTNVGVRFTDTSVFNCIGNGTVLPVPGQGAAATPVNNQQRWVRIIYGGANSAVPANVIPNIVVGGVPVTDASGALLPAWSANPILPGIYNPLIPDPNPGPMGRGYVLTGAGGVGTPDPNGVIELPAGATVPSVVSQLITTSSPVGQVVGQRFYITLQYWGVCNRYDQGFEPVEISNNFVEIITKPVPPVAVNKDFCDNQNMSAQTFAVTSTIGASRAGVNWYNSNPTLGGATLLTNPNGTNSLTFPANPGFAIAGFTPVPNGSATGTFSLWATQLGTLNACESDPVQVVIRKREVLTQPGVITNTNAPVLVSGATVCQGTTGLTFEVPDPVGSETIGGAWEYLWTVPAGLTITGGQGTRTVTITASSAGANQTITVVKRYTTNDFAGNRCTSPSRTFTLNVDPTAVGGTVSGPTDICAGQNTGLITLTGNTGSIIRWEVNGVTDASLGTANPINPIINASGSYTLKAIVQSGVCPAVGSTVDLTVTVAPVPGKPSVAAAPSTTICEGSSITLTAGNVGAATYNWFKEPTAWAPNNSATALQLWLRADAATFTDAGGATPATNGQGIQRWNDQSGGGRNASQATVGDRPVLLTGALNGLPVVDFASADFIGGTFGNPGSVTVFTVAKSDVNPQTGTLFDVTTNKYTQLLEAGNFRSRVTNTTPTTFTTSRSFTDVANYHIFYGDHSTNTNVKGSIDGVPLTVSAVSGVLGNAASYRLGSRITGGNSFDGKIAEVIVYNGVISLADRQRVEGYLAHKWGLTANLPADHPYKNIAPLNTVAATGLSFPNLDTPGESGTYRVQAIGGAPTVCVSEPSNPISITINPRPTASNPTGGGSVCSGNPAPNIVWTLTGSPPFNITYSVTHSGGTPIAPISVLGYMPPEAVAPYTFTIVNPNPVVDFGFGIAPETFTYQLTSLQDNNSCNATALGTSRAVSIGGSAPVIGPITAQADVCDDGGGTNPPDVFIDLGVANAGVIFSVGYQINGANQAVSNYTANASGIVTLQPTYAQFGSTPGSYVITITSLINTATLCSATVPIVGPTVRINPRPAAPTGAVRGIACSTDASGAPISVTAPAVGFTIVWSSTTPVFTAALGTIGGTRGNTFTPNSTATATYHAFTRDDFGPTNCLSAASLAVQHIQDIAPTPSNAGPNAANCSGTFVLAANAAGVNERGTWIVPGIAYQQNFNGFANGTTSSAAINGWTLNLSDPNLFNSGVGSFDVQGGQFALTNADGNLVTGAEAVWLSPVITGAFTNRNISVNLSSTATHEAGDYLRVYYRIDGGAETILPTNGNQNGNITGTVTATATALSGATSIQLVIRANNNAADETYRFDNIIISDAGAPTITDSNSPTATVANLPVGGNVLTWRISTLYGVCAPSNSTVTLTRNPLPTVVSPTPVLCEDTFGGGFVNNIDLNSYSNAITGLGGVYASAGPSAFTSAADDRRIDWFTDAGRTLAVPNASDVDGLVNGAIRYYRVTTISTNCTSNGQITFTINPLPTANTRSYTYCPDSPPGFGAASLTASVNLTLIPVADIIGTDPPAQRVLTYHNTLADAQAGINAIVNTSITATTSVFARTRNTVTNCVNTSTINLVFQPRAANNQIRDALNTLLVNGLSGAPPYSASTFICASSSLVLFQINPAINPGATYSWSVPAPSYAGEFEVLTATTDYFIILRFPNATSLPASLYNGGIPITVTETLGTSCSGNPLTLLINVDASPSQPLVTGPTEVCENGLATYTITSGAGTSHTWSIPPGATITNSPTGSSINVQLGTFDGQVTVTASSGTGCISPTSTPINVDVIPRPSFTFTSNPLCSGGNVSTAVTLTPSIPAPLNAGDVRFNWEVINIVGAVSGTNVGNTATGVTSITETLFNTSGIAGTVLYRVTPVGPAATLCQGNPQNISVTVNPEPVLNLSNKTICSDEPAGYEIRLTPANLPAGTQFSWAAPTMSSGGPQGSSGTNVAMGAAGTVHINDVFTNTTNAAITATYVITANSSITGCASNQAVPARTVVITIAPKPVVSTSLNTAVCSDANIGLTLATEIGSIGATSYEIVSRTLSGGLTASGTNAAVPATGVAANYLANDRFTNLTSGTLNVTYVVRARGAINNCLGDTRTITIQIHPEPVVANLNTTRCSDTPIAITLATTGTSVAALDYNIISVTSQAGLVANAANAAVPALNVPDNYLSNDQFTNTTNGSLTVTYIVEATGTISNCVGDQRTIVITINPEPVVITGLDGNRCSDAPMALTLNTNGISVAALNYNIISRTVQAGLTPAGTNVAVPANGVAANYLTNDRFNNVTAGPLTVTYVVEAVGTINNCVSDQRTIVMTIDPKPVIVNTLSATRCSDEAVGLTLATEFTSVTAANYNIISRTVQAGLTASPGNVGVPANGVAAGYLTNDIFTNTTAGNLTVTYIVEAVGSVNNCIGNQRTVVMTISPKPVVSTLLDNRRCSDAPIELTLNTNGTSVGALNYNIASRTIQAGLTPNAGNAVVPFTAVADNYLFNDRFTNTTSTPLTVSYVVVGRGLLNTNCLSAPQTITITIDPEPVVASTLNDTRCSDTAIGLVLNTNGTSIGALNYNIISRTPQGGLTPAGTNVAIPANGVAANYLNNDRFTNTTNAPLTVTYIVEAVGLLNGCVGDQRTIVMTIDPEPVVSTLLNDTECSDQPIGLVLNTAASSVSASSYNIISRTLQGGLVANAGNVGVPANNVADNYLINDRFTNTTGGSLTVTYLVEARGSINGCVGDQRSIVITIDPEPTVLSTLSATRCSDVAIGLTLGTEASGIGAASYNIISRTLQAGLTGDAGNATVPQAGVNTTYLLNDRFTNTTSGSLTVTYVVQAVGTINGCLSDERTIVMTIDPEPVISALLDATRCSDVATGLVLNTNGSSISASSYNIISRTAQVGLVAAVTNVTVPANNVTSTYLSTDRFTNTTGGSLTVTYVVEGRGAINGCIGDQRTIVITIDPEPVVATNLNAVRCSDAAIGLVLNTNGTSIGALDYSIVSRTIQAGLVANPGNATVPASNIADNYLANDRFTNTTAASLTVSYVVEARGTINGCAGDQRTITITIDPEPVVSTALNARQCNDQPIGLVLATNGTSVNALNYNIISRTLQGGLTGDPGNALVPASNVANNYLASDRFLNPTTGSLTVTYVVEANGTINGCVGDQRTIVITIDPEPVVAILDATRCSDDPSGLILNANGVSVSATSYNIISRTAQAGLTANGSNVAVPATGVSANYLSNDRFTNTTAGSLTVTYVVEAIGSINGCVSDQRTIVLTINPVPVVATNLNETRCSDEAYGRLIATNGSSVAATSYNITADVSEFTAAGLTATPTTGTGLAANAIQNDAFTNTTNAQLRIFYTIIPNGPAGCVGAARVVEFRVNPEPVLLNPGLDRSACSDVSTGLTLSTNGISVAATTYRITAFNANGLLENASNVVKTTSLFPVTVGASQLATEKFTNDGNGPVIVEYTVVPVGPAPSSCLGDPVIVRVTINPEPRIIPGAVPVCSGEAVGTAITLSPDVGAVTPDQFELKRIVNTANLPTGGTNAGLGIYTTGTFLQNDIFINNIDGNSRDVVYEIVPITAGCRGEDASGFGKLVTLTVNPAPDLADNLGRTVCSGDVSGITLSTRVVPTASAPAANYNITSIIVAGGLVPDGAVNLAFPRLGRPANEISADRFTNPTNAPLTVTYRVVPVTAFGCRGVEETIVLTIEPTITMLPIAAIQTCSDSPNSPNTWSFTLDSNVTPSSGNITFDYSAVSSPVGAVTGFLISQSNLPELTVINDKLVNTSNNVATVTYTITPKALGAKSGAGCSAVAPTIVTVTVEPKPRLSISPSTQTVCEGTPSSMVLSSTTVPGSGTLQFVQVSAVPTGGMTLTSAPKTTYLNGEAITDVWSNPTINVQTVTYTFRSQIVGGLGCSSEDITVVLTVNPSPTITASAQADICNGDFINITLTPDVANTVAQWTVSAPPTIVGASNGAGNLIFQTLFNSGTAPATATYTVTPRVNGCNGTPIVINVGVNPKPRIDGLISPVTVCHGSSLNVTLNNTIAGARYIWTVDNPSGLPGITEQTTAGAGIINQALLNTTGSQATLTYTITPFGPTACPGDQKIMIVTVAPEITAQFISTSSSICKGSSEFLIMQIDGQAPFQMVYSDGTTDFTLPNTGNFKVIQVQPTVTTTYTIKSIRDALGCSITVPAQSITVTVGETDASFNIVGPVASCGPYAATFQFNQVAGTEYTWQWFDGSPDEVFLATTSVPNQTITHTFTNPNPNGAITYKVTLRTQLPSPFPGCFKSTTQNVVVFPTIITNAFADRSEICSNEQVQFFNQSFGVSTHKWFYRVQGTTTELDVRTTSTVNYRLVNATNTNPIIYEIVYRADNGNCPAPDVVIPISVYRGITAGFNEGTIPPYISGNSRVTFTNTSVPVDATQFRYEWQFGLNGTPATASGAGPFNVDYSTPGLRDVSLLVTNIAAEAAGLSCSSEFKKTINVPLLPLVAAFTASPVRSCFPSKITVTANTSTGDGMEWRLVDSNGRVAATSNALLPVFNITNPGRYSIFLTTKSTLTGQVANTQQTNFEVFDKPVASFQLRPTVVFVPDTEMATFNFSTGATDYVWDFGDGGKSELFEPTYVYKIEGVYDVTLIAQYDHGDNLVCADTTSNKVTARQGGVTRVPNAFTPSNNGPTGGTPGNGGLGQLNDVFLPIVRGVEEFNMQIFDRWGNLIFESNNAQIGWDGYDKNGRLLPSGVYVYKLTLRLSDGQRTTQVGDITMIR